MTLASSSTLVKRQPPLLPQTLPTTQAGWTQFVTQMQEWYQSLQSLQSAPNVLPAQYSVFSQNGIPPLTLAGCSVTQDTTHTLYGPQSLKVVVSGAPATLALTGYPIAIQPGQLWYCAFEVYGSNFAGSISLNTSAGTTVSSGLASTATGWNLVWTLLDLTAYQDTQATWIVTFTNPGTFWLDGLQMSPAGSPFLQQPPFVVGTGAIPAATTIGTTPQPGSITGDMIAPVTITAVNIAPVTITAAQIAPVAITAAQIAPLTITAAQIANNAIGSVQIAANSITAAQIAANTITSGQIAANTITSGQIAAGSILGNSIAANTITSLQIAANTITAQQIAANTITGNNIAASSITALQIASNTITTNQLAAGAVLAGNISANSLSSISANLGAVTAGVIQMSASTSYIEFNNGAFMKVSGVGFGSTSSYLEWYGPTQSSSSNFFACNDSNGLYWLKTDGTYYFGVSQKQGATTRYVGPLTTTLIIPVANTMTVELWGDTGLGGHGNTSGTGTQGGSGGSGGYSRSIHACKGYSGYTININLKQGNSNPAASTVSGGTFPGFTTMSAIGGGPGTIATANVDGYGGFAAPIATGGNAINLAGNPGGAGRGANLNNSGTPGAPVAGLYSYGSYGGQGNLSSTTNNPGLPAVCAVTFT